MNQKRIGAYVGVDPTAPSLHIGHLLPLMALFWMYVHGFQAVTLVSISFPFTNNHLIKTYQLGGATAGVGDPTGRTTTRDKLPRVNRQSNMITMHYQFKSLWANIEEYGRKYDYKWEWSWRRHVANNNAWLNKLPLLELLRLLGEGTRIGEMLRRET